MGVFKNKKDNWYWIDYYYEGRRKRERISPSKKVAENVLAKRKTEIAENRFLDKNKIERIKFRDFASIYLNNHSKANKRSWKSTDRGLVNSLVDFFGHRHLHEISPMLVEQYKSERRQYVSPATVNRSLSCLRCMFNKAILWGKGKENPVRQVKFFKEDNKRVRFLELHEVARLLGQCSEKLKAIVTVALNTGMRKNELATLKWRDVDFGRNVIAVVKTKSGEKRHIPLNAISKKALMSVRKHPESEYIFCGKTGKPFDWRKSFETALKRAGILDFRFHDLRHSFASQMVMSGIDLNTVRELMGHKDMSLTLRYAHLSPDHKSKAVEILGNRMDTYMDTNRSAVSEAIICKDVTLEK